MKYFFFTTLLLLIFVTTTWAEDIAIIKNAEGVVTIKRGTTILPAHSSEKLQQGDILITASDGHVGIIFHDGSVLALRENSFLQIKAFEFEPLEENFNFRLQLKKGTALFESGKIGDLAPENFSFEVPEGTIGIRGTKFLVEVM
jgi:hypothetical protein